MWRSGCGAAHLQRCSAAWEVGAAPEAPALAVARRHLHAAGRAGGCCPVALGRKVEKLLAQGFGQALEHGEEELAVEQGDPVFGGEGAGLVGEAVRGHEEGLVDALVGHDPAQFAHWFYAHCLVPGLVLHDGCAALRGGVVLEQTDIHAAVGSRTW